MKDIEYEFNELPVSEEAASMKKIDDNSSQNSLSISISDLLLENDAYRCDIHTATIDS